ncbi:diaminopimelate epimerase [Pedobacter faecalis]|uniref:diaminopimelate epimerase n=1 Tax=Pedobacter faecalis TaxID=3041495 RepID=UPI00254AB84F|nr:diaminopimelate epimerase [Pedobacter sp. ELA7]
MEIQFYKYQGAGNDFILVDNRSQTFPSGNHEGIKKLCDRRFGIGGDGFMLLQNREGYDFEMVYYNADGRPGTMCGNGGRCIVSFARFLNIAETETNFLAVDGPHYAKISESGEWIDLQMIDVDAIAKDDTSWVLNTGSPHYVRQTADLATYDVYNQGKAIRNNDTYRAEGVNVNFVEDMGSHLFVRTFERGVEDETYACGTGVTAVALAMAAYKGQKGAIETPVKVLGGDLTIRFDYDGSRFSNIFLCGPAKQVFRGTVQI